MGTIKPKMREISRIGKNKFITHLKLPTNDTIATVGNKFFCKTVGNKFITHLKLPTNDTIATVGKFRNARHDG